MLSRKKNELLTRVGPGTPMGELLRRYWHPIGAVDEMARTSIKPVRLLGEDLVLYKDLSGTHGLVDRRCAHRGADLSYGFVEPCGIRCNYHGWAYDEQGACISMPYEDTANPKAKLRERVKLKAYKVQALAGLLWAYLGPEPAPLVADWEPFSWAHGFKQIVFSDIPCNWLQCQENSIDPVHFEWMHANWSTRLSGKMGPYAPTHLKLDFEEFEYGFTYKRIREDTDENHPLWTTGRVCLWPQAFFLGDHFEWRVPVDDENSLSVSWFFQRVPHESEPFVQGDIPSWWSPIKDEKTGRWISSHVINQDIVGWVGQGTIADRTRETLGASDRGIAMFRRQLLSDLDAIRRGEDPKALIRDPEKNTRVVLPIAARRLFEQGLSRQDLLAHPILGSHMHEFPFASGQPEHVARAFRAAMDIGVPD